MKILIYDDSPDFGGHQVMAVRGIEALAQTGGLELTVMHHPENRKLSAALQQLDGLQAAVADPGTIPARQPDIVLCIQGDIAQSAAGIAAAKKSRAECISYLAVPHTLAHMGAKFGAVRDLKNKPLFNKPDRFITISDSMKKIMQQRGCRRPITVVPNGIPAPPIPKLTAHDDQFAIGIIGRIEFKQKQQDFFVQAYRKHPALFGRSRVLIVGSGPDEQPLKKMIRNDDRIAHLPRQDDMEAVYEVLDMLVIPSRFEGVPLVMLEALARGIPVIGSRCDGMQDILPHSWTFTPGDSASLAAVFHDIRETWTKNIDDLQHRILEEHSLERFKAQFVKAVLGR